MSEKELFGNSEQLESGHEKDHVADPGKMVGDSISRQAAIEAIKEDKIDLTNPNVAAVFKATGDFEKVETQVMTCDRHIKILKDLPSAQQIPWDRKTRNSMAGTLQMLRRLAYNINGVMDVVDDDNVRRLIGWLEGGQDDT